MIQNVDLGLFMIKHVDGLGLFMIKHVHLGLFIIKQVDLDCL